VPLLLEQIVVKSESTGIGLKQLLGGEIEHSCCGSSKMDVTIAQKYFQNKIIVLEGYGLTEMSPIISYNRLDDFKLGTVGKPLEDTLVNISKEGEVLVNGKGIFKGYYLNELATENKIKNGYLSTGDIGYFDDDGYLYISGRYADTFKLSNGKFFNPIPVEILIQDTFQNISKCTIIKGLKKAHIFCFLSNKIDLSTELSYEVEIKKLIGNNILLNETFEVIFTNVPLTINSGLLTSTLKVRRYALKNYFNNQIVMFEKYSSVSRIFFSIIEDRNKIETLKQIIQLNDFVKVIIDTAKNCNLNLNNSDVNNFLQEINNLNDNAQHSLSEIELLKGKNNNCFNDK
jgi:long-subunit acyl-CoA synthetase (AMP-forming)